MLAKEFDLPFTIHELKENATVRKLEQLIASKAPEAKTEERLRYPLSRTQQGILVECLSHPESAIYNIPILYTLDPDLEPEKVKRALAEAFANHPGLFTRLVKDENGEICAELPEEAQDLEGRKKIVLERIEERSAENIDEVKEALVHPFDLFGNGLFRLSLIHAEKTCLFADFHHILCDGTSVNLLMEDVSNAYEGKALEPEGLSGFAVAAEEDKRLHSEFYQHAKKFYEGLLSGADTDCLPPATIHETEERTGELSYRSPFPTEAFESFCKEHQISMSALFNAAFGYTLGKYINRDDVTYCTIYNGRSDTRMLRTVSMLVKTFPVRCSLESSRSVKDYLEEISERMMDSMANDLFSFAEIASKFHLGADILFTYQGDLFEAGSFCGRPCERETLELDEAKAAMDLDAVIENGVLYLNGFYRADLFDQVFMEGFAESILQAAFEFTKKEKLSEINLLSAQMHEKVLALNETAEDIPEEAVHRMFERQVKEHADQCAVITANGTLTYKKLEEDSNRIANALIKRGVLTDEIVGLISGRTKEVFIGEIGIMKSGGAFLPIVPEYPDERVDYCLTDAGCRFVLTTDMIRKEKEELFRDKPYQVLTFEELLNESASEAPERKVPESALCYCIYTSGTTGKPKGVMIEHRNFRAFAEPCRKNLEAFSYQTCGHVVLSVISVSFDFSLMEVLLPLCLGLTVCMANEEEIHNPAALAKKIKAAGVDVVSGTPSFLGSLLDFPAMQEALSKVKLYDLGAESFPSSLYDRMREVSPDAVIINGYGPTETTISCIAKKLENGVGITIGKPEANVKAWCMDKQQRLLPVGAMGELVIGGALVGRGYKNLPEKTADVFVTIDGIRAFRSGDIVRWLPNGEIEFFGRMDNQVKLRGFRIELDEIENNMNSFPGIRSSKVVVRNNGSEDYLAGFFTAEGEVDLSELTAHLRENLTYYMVPSVLMQLPKMPLTINGKIDKKQLPEVEFSASREYKAPETETEKTVCEIFRTVLHLEKVGVTENFFEIGGTSLTATNIVMRLEEAGFEVVYKNIFEFPTPRELAAFLSGESVEENAFSDDYDYSDIRRICAYNDLQNVDQIRKKDLNNLILTGASGFLGIHVLKEFLQNEKGTAYCLIRRGKYESPELRLQNMLMYYFGDPMKDMFEKRIVCIEADITDPESLSKLKDANADLVINCAACVKHFVSDDILERTNYRGVQNLIDVCLESGKELIQISTTSVGGFLPESRRHTQLHECDLFIDQTIDNEYIRTKFLAERAVLEACASKGLKGKVIRVGNLMSRASDGEFQINFISSSFMRSLKSYKQLGVFPVTMLHDPAEFSPVDSTAQAILKIAASESKFTVFHAYNSHYIYMSDVILALNHFGFRIDIVSEEEFAQRIKDAASDERLNEALLGLIAYDGNGQMIYPTAPDNRLTSELLYRLDYFWPITDPPYLNNIIEVLDGFEFFDID
ncbi:MAG: amino acid adenylation domain-containing protein [Parasporobacterium sp.]|nr:amino acid adenylation domain-containing protein [Parasporobacterium sp.]